MAMVLSSLVPESENRFGYLFHGILAASLIQAIIAYFCLFSENFHEAILDKMKSVGLYTVEHLEIWGFRIYGYGNSLMYSIPITQAIISAWVVIYGIINGKLLYPFLGISIFFSAMINAKNAIVIFVVTLFIGFFIEVRKKNRHIFYFFAFLVTFWLLAKYGLEFLTLRIPKLFEWVDLIFNKETLKMFYLDYYFDISRWKMPSGLQIVFGSGIARNKQGYDADMGFVNDIWLGGYLYAAFTILLVVYFAKRIEANPCYKNGWNQILKWSLLVCFFLANMKGVAFHYSSFMSLILIIYLFGEEKSCESVLGDL
jgi:hypothetical protein